MAEEQQLGFKVEEGPGGRYIHVPKGLYNVVVDVTSISGVDPKGLYTTYRGYDVVDIGRNADFYEAAYLVLYGRLPCEDEYREIKRKIDGYRGAVPRKVFEALRNAGPSHPMYYGSLGVVVMGQHLVSSEWRFDDDYIYDHALRIIAAMPVIFAAGWHIARTGTYIDPDPSLPHAMDALRMITGREPTWLEARAFETSLVLYMDHGFNASTFTVRVIASTLSDLYSAVAGGIGALKGPLHGGANEKALKMLLEARKEAEERGRDLVDYIEEFILNKLKRREKIIGFGHRIYKRRDPRTSVIAEYIRQLPEGEYWLAVVRKAEETAWRAKRLPANIDIYTGILYYQLGIPLLMYTPVFAMGRVVGWCAHYIEQVRNNKLIRPAEKYVGPIGLKYVPMSGRCKR
ncbi:citrate/2-methylcitrate synthase [Stetteria hydrogenophila]